MVPRADTSSESGEDASLYGVSLVFRSHLPTSNISVCPAKMTLVQDAGIDEQPARSLASPVRMEHAAVDEDDNNESTTNITVCLPREFPILNDKLANSPWADQVARAAISSSSSSSLVDQPVVIGLALVSQRNVILSMRETLLKVLQEFSFAPKKSAAHHCALVDMLGLYAHADVERESLRCLLKPFLRFGVSAWLERPIASQRQEFEDMAGEQLIQSLPPIALALMFVTILLEQKVVFSSSRRGVLLSASIALSKLMKPLKWCHLLVPRVPASLAADLLQYPAPFILGMASEDPGIMDLVRELPQDVTLVDLDVGRVILAPSFAHNSELGRGTPNNADTARALRSQVLYLAQSLGGVFGTVIDPQTWLSDRPWLDPSGKESAPSARFEKLCNVCTEFVEELLAGTASCCYFMEEVDEGQASEPTILFDEDKFFEMKRLRELSSNRAVPLFTKANCITKLSLSLENFDLVLEVFLRCQSMNAYLGTVERDAMAFGL